MIIKLKYPIEFKDEEGERVKITELEFGRMKAKHLRALPKEFFEAEGNVNTSVIVDIIQVISGISPEAAGELDLDDIKTIGDNFENFFGEYLPAGETSES